MILASSDQFVIFSYIFQITVKECSNENSQCAFVVDKILEITSDVSAAKCNFGNIAVLYRRQVKFIYVTNLVSLKVQLHMLNLYGVLTGVREGFSNNFSQPKYSIQHSWCSFLQEKGC